MKLSLSRLVNLQKQGILLRKTLRLASTSTAANVNEQQGLPKDDSKFWVKSPHRDIQPVVGVEIHELIFSKITQWGNLPAIECGISGKKYTYDEIYKHSRAFGAALIQAGFKRGDTIGVVLPNIPEFPIVMLGCWSAGLIVSCINPAYTEEEIKRQLKSSVAKCAITIEHFLNSIRSAKTTNPELKSIVIIGDAHEDCHTFSEMIKCDTKNVEFSTGANKNTMEEIALLPYSSGTTGPPKGVLLTHYNITTNLMQYVVEAGVGPTKSYDETGDQERLIGLLPFFHSYGSAAILIAGLYQGSNIVTLPRFEHNTFLDAIKNHKPTVLHLVTPLISHIVNSPDFNKKDLSSLKAIVGAAAPIGNVLINKILEKAQKYIFFAEGYGMTELSPLSHMLSPITKNTKIGSCGSLVPNTWSKVIDVSTGDTLGPNCRGELLVKGPQQGEKRNMILKPPFTLVTAKQKVLMAQNLWNTKNPVKVAAAYTPDSAWRNRDLFFKGTDKIVEFLTKKWTVELDYKLEKQLFCFQDNKIAVHFQYEFHNEAGQWFRAYGNEHWTFNSEGLMETRDMSCNDVPILESERKFK